MCKETGARVLTCVYCGQEYPQGTPAWGNKVLTDHIKVCPKHPMREAEGKIMRLKEALAWALGVETREELEHQRFELSLAGKCSSARAKALEVLLEVM